jgi:predicted acetyltransferase
MSSVEIKRVTGNDYFTQARAIAGYAFGATPHVRDTSKDEETLKFMEHVRAYVAFVDGEPQATATLFPMVQNVRGKLLSMSGVGGVATMPAARRKGLVRSLFATMYETMREFSEPITTLYPFRESFYERVGYAPMSQSKFVRFPVANLAPLTKLERRGTAEQLSMRDGFDAWREYLERYQTRVHGFALNNIENAAHAKHLDRMWVVLARDPDGTVIGASTFKITGYTGKLAAETFYYDSGDARLLLLEWFARHVDQVSEIQINLAWDDLPEYWAPDLYTRVVNHDEFFTTPMGRVIDITALNGLRVGPGVISVDIVDPQCEWNAGAWTLASDDNGMLSVERGGNAAFALTIQGLSSLVFAGQDPGDFRLRGWGDPDTESQATLRSMFPRAFIRLHEEF